MYSNRLFSPLRYPGGKARFAPFISDVIKLNGWRGCDYIEPYAGGAGVALDLLFGGAASRIHINDADPAVFDFWLAATRHSAELIELVETATLDISEWNRWRSLMNGSDSASPAERGFATLYMNRTNRSGILNGGVIGGKAQAGKYRLDARFKKPGLISRLERIASYSDRIFVYHEDALELLVDLPKELPPCTFTYLDPPYFAKGRGLYRNYYGPDDHAAIADLVQGEKFSDNWLVSYDNAPEIADLYNRSIGYKYDLYYSAHRHYDGQELMFFPSNLKVPKAEELPGQGARRSGPVRAKAESIEAISTKSR